tara:strand:- start:177 stop:836 length:660 start_codon:yes stop_codon:yes gene_type:complete
MANKEKWGYGDAEAARGTMLQGMNTDAFGGLADEYGGYATSMQGMGMDMMQGKGPILDAMRLQQSEELDDIGAGQNLAQSRALSARGMGRGGLASVLGSKTTSSLGEQSRKGLLGIQQYGLQAGNQMSQTAQGWGDMGANALGSQAAMFSQANQAQLGQTQTNAANQASWMQGEDARVKAANSRRGGMIGGVIGGIGGFMLGGPQGAQLGYSLGSSIGS